jgi:hypothetical protein
MGIHMVTVVDAAGSCPAGQLMVRTVLASPLRSLRRGFDL